MKGSESGCYDATRSSLGKSRQPVAKVCIYVCTACNNNAAVSDGERTAGERLLQNLALKCSEFPEIRILPVDCLAVCNKCITIAFQSAGKWSYTIGNIDPENDVDDIIAVGRAILASEHGVLAMNERPGFFRKGVISRLPPAQ